ncbi:MAG: hypothetical protein JO197_08295 [Acidobacteria bacterium]|nr:hypothetical protein [Acidobacteriota bacterium]MBV9477634.1 hypothetical protein [Acidobacteriota bacterium]
MAEQTFLNENNAYVSNARVVFHGTAYATANIASVRAHMTLPNRGGATLLILVGVGLILAGFGAVAGQSDAAAGLFVFGVGLCVVGIAAYRSHKPTYHVMLATGAGERQALTSSDRAFIDRATHAIAEAITFRG